MGLIIDNFAGGGGASVALEQALGRKVDIAINHDPDAIAMHAANHPETEHYQDDVFSVDKAAICKGQPIDVAWFSPDCKHFSRAKGRAPVSKRVRGLAWVVLQWAALPKWQRPRVIFLENVEEFQTWGPICRQGYPDKSKAGETFRLWVSHLEALGYTVEWRSLVASDYGAPTIRKRLFLVARCDGEPIRWPEPTHADPKLKTGLKPWRTAAEIIDWSLPCPSIFSRKRPLKPNTMARIARGLQRYVFNNPQPFIVNLTHGGRVEAVSEPLKTVTAANRGEKALVTPTLIQTGYGERKGQKPRALDLFKPLGTVVSGGSKHALVAPTIVSVGHGYSGGRREYPVAQPALTITSGGNHQALVAAFLAQHNTGVTGHKADKPMSTITGRGTQQQVVTSHLIKMRGTGTGSATDAPVHTLTAGGQHIGEVRAFLIKYFGTQQKPELAEPLHTVTTKDRFGLVMVHGEPYEIVDIGMRMLVPHELYAAQGFPDDYIIRPEINGKVMTKSASIARCGNSVSPPPAVALIEANAPMFSRVEVAA
ncbi:MAG: DNA cytosine methyltransferase [Henriciella sp.]|nr:DNA cytosine methyltransferase [Henriciella sp.]